MSISEQLDFDLYNVPVEVFDLADGNLTIDSLTTGYGMAENAASIPICAICACSSCCPQ